MPTADEIDAMIREMEGSRPPVISEPVPEIVTPPITTRKPEPKTADESYRALLSDAEEKDAMSWYQDMEEQAMAEMAAKAPAGAGLGSLMKDYLPGGGMIPDGARQFLDAAGLPLTTAAGGALSAAKDIGTGLATEPHKIVAGGPAKALNSMTDLAAQGIDALAKFLNDNVADLSQYDQYLPEFMKGPVRQVDAEGHVNGPIPTDWAKTDTWTGGIGQAIAQFMTGFSAAGGAGGMLAKAPGLSALPAAEGLAGALAVNTAKSAFSNMAAFDGHEANLANLIEMVPALQNPVTEFLASSPDDSDAVGRLKNGLAGFVPDMLIGGFVTGLQGIKFARRMKALTGEPTYEDAARKLETGSSEPGEAYVAPSEAEMLVGAEDAPIWERAPLTTGADPAFEAKGLSKTATEGEYKSPALKEMPSDSPAIDAEAVPAGERWENRLSADKKYIAEAKASGRWPSWGETHPERALLSLKEQDAVKAWNAIIEPFMYPNGGLKVMERWQAEAKAIDADPANVEIGLAYQAARLAWLEHKKGGPLTRGELIWEDLDRPPGVPSDAAAGDLMSEYVRERFKVVGHPDLAVKHAAELRKMTEPAATPLPAFEAKGLSKTATEGEYKSPAVGEMTPAERAAVAASKPRPVSVVEIGGPEKPPSLAWSSPSKRDVTPVGLGNHDTVLRSDSDLRVLMGTPHLPPPQVISDYEAALGRLDYAIPQGTDVGVMTKAEAGRGGNILVTFRRRDGSTLTALMTPAGFKGRRAFATGDGAFIGFMRQGATPNELLRIDGEILHEIVHVGRINKVFPDAEWLRLVGHGRSLRVMEMRWDDFYRAIGDEEIIPHLAHPEKTIADTYTKLYANHQNGKELWEQEIVAHMLELDAHGYWKPGQLAPVADVIKQLKAGAWTGKAAKPGAQGAAAGGSIPAAAPEAKGGTVTARLVSDEEAAVEIKRLLGAGDKHARYGLRVTQEPLTVGSKPPNSRVWDDGDPTNDMLDGASTIEFDPTDLDSIENAIRAATSYDGDHVSVIGADRYEFGQDKGELVMKDGRVVATFERESRAYNDKPLKLVIGGEPDSAMGGTAPAAAPAAKVQPLTDSLGYYSKALEAARLLKQAKGTPEQMLAQLKSAGVKDAEIEATKLGEFLTGKTAVTREEIVSFLTENRVKLLEKVRPRAVSSFYSTYSRDPANPTYREIELHLPKTGKDDFQSGHFPEPNITGHMMVSEVATPDGKGTLLIDQIQSDWGQQIRTEGAKNEAKIAKLKAKIADFKAEFDLPDDAMGWLHGSVWDVGQTIRNLRPENRTLRYKADELAKMNALAAKLEAIPKERLDAIRLVDAELRTAEDSAPGHPLVNTTDQWVDTTLRRGLLEAVRSGKDYIAIPSGKAVLAYNPGDEAGMEGFYDKIVPKNLRKLLEKLDKATPAAERVETLLSPSGSAGRGEGFMVFRITPEAKRKILEEGQPLFAAAAEIKASLGKLPEQGTPKEMIDSLIANGIPEADALIAGLRSVLGNRESVTRAEIEGWLNRTTMEAKTGPQLPAGEGPVYINLARISGPDDIKSVLQQMADAARVDGTVYGRGVRSNATTKEAAEAENAFALLIGERKGNLPLAEEQYALRQLWGASAAKLLEVSKMVVANPSPERLVLFRRLMATHNLIQQEVIGIRTETARALQQWAIPSGAPEMVAKQLEQTLTMNGGAELSQELAQRIANLADKPGGMVVLDKFTRSGGFLATTRDMFYEAWRNALLSSPTTHVVNSVSNSATLLTSMIERAVAGRLSEMTGNVSGVQIGEATAMLWGSKQALRDAFIYLAKNRRFSGLYSDVAGTRKGPAPYEMAPWNRAISKETMANSTSSLYRRMAASPLLGKGVDMLGSIVNTPGSMMMGADEFFKAINDRAQLWALAYRQAAQEAERGLIQPEALGKRITGLILEPTPKMQMEAAEFAAYNTFTSEPGPITKKILELRAQTPGAGVILPFVATPANILKYSFERTPLAPLMSRFREDVRAGGSRRDMAIAKMGLGSMVIGMAVDMGFDGSVTGGGPSDPGERQLLMRSGWRPYSVRIETGKGDDGKPTYRYVAYDRMDPVGYILGIGAELGEVMAYNGPEQADGFEEAVIAATLGAAESFTEKSYLTGFAGVVEAVSDAKRYGEGYADRTIASLIPSGIGAITRQLDPYQKYVTDATSALRARTPGLSASVPNRVDFWGRGIKLSSGLGWGFDMLTPMKAGPEAKQEPIDKELLRLRMFPEHPASMVIEGESVSLRNLPEAKRAWVIYTSATPASELPAEKRKRSVDPITKYGDKTLLESLNELVGEERSDNAWVAQLQFDYQAATDDEKQDIVQKVIRHYRSAAKSRVMDEFPALMGKLKAQKIGTGKTGGASPSPDTTSPTLEP